MKKYTEDDLRSKLLNMYPEIGKKGVSLSLNYDEGKKSWIVKLAKNNKEHMINLPEADADTCVTGKFCVPFKSELDDVLNRFEGR